MRKDPAFWTEAPLTNATVDGETGVVVFVCGAGLPVPTGTACATGVGSDARVVGTATGTAGSVVGAGAGTFEAEVTTAVGGGATPVLAGGANEVCSTRPEVTFPTGQLVTVAGQDRMVKTSVLNTV